jgi:multimeric flavodoxin WrbA
MLSLVAEAMAKLGVETKTLRLADHNIPAGVKSNEGPADDWPNIRELIIKANILILRRPIWASHRAQQNACWNAWTPSLGNG